MGTDNDSRYVERNGQLGNTNAGFDHPTYGLDRYSWNQGYNALLDFQIFENVEPCLVARGGGAR